MGWDRSDANSVLLVSPPVLVEGKAMFCWLFYPLLLQRLWVLCRPWGTWMARCSEQLHSSSWPQKGLSEDMQHTTKGFTYGAGFLRHPDLTAAFQTYLFHWPRPLPPTRGASTDLKQLNCSTLFCTTDSLCLPGSSLCECPQRWKTNGQ